MKPTKAPAKRVPAVLFHGTNPIAAAAICLRGRIAADEPVDDDGLGRVVCTTACHEMARNFATEFVRLNSPYDVGVIFKIDGKAVAKIHNVIPHVAETACDDEKEFRIQGDISVANQVISIEIVGRANRLNDPEFVSQMWSDAIKNRFAHHFSGEEAFASAVKILLSQAS